MQRFNYLNLRRCKSAKVGVVALQATGLMAAEVPDFVLVVSHAVKTAVALRVCCNTFHDNVVRIAAKLLMAKMRVDVRLGREFSASHEHREHVDLDL